MLLRLFPLLGGVASALYRRPDLAVEGCNVHEGRWIPVSDRRQTFPYGSSCPFTDPRQMCAGKDPRFLDWEWQPHQCTLPFFDSARFLELLRNRVMAFVGDSLGRSQFQSLSCLLAAADDAQHKDTSGKFVDSHHYPKYNATVCWILSPFLVAHTPKTFKKEMGPKTVHLDIPDPEWHFRQREFDVLFFSAAGRW